MATVPYQLTVDGVATLRVHSLRGKEALSESWRFDVVVSGASAEETERLTLGRRATPGGEIDVVRTRTNRHGLDESVSTFEVRP